MPKNYYLPTSDLSKVIWLNNFASKFATAAPSLGFVAADVTSVYNDAAMFAYLVNLTEAYQTAKEQRVHFKNLMKEGPMGKPMGALPVTPVVADMPTIVAPGIFPRISQLVQRIKSNSAYSEALGRDLGIIGSQAAMDMRQVKPVLRVSLKGSAVEVQWQRGDADAMYLEVDRGTGVWEFLSMRTGIRLVDEVTPNKFARWRYRGIFLVNDEQTGQWSDEVSIVVG